MARQVCSNRGRLAAAYSRRQLPCICIVFAISKMVLCGCAGSKNFHNEPGRVVTVVPLRGCNDRIRDCSGVGRPGSEAGLPFTGGRVLARTLCAVCNTKVQVSDAPCVATARWLIVSLHELSVSKEVGAYASAKFSAHPKLPFPRPT